MQMRKKQIIIGGNVTKNKTSIVVITLGLNVLLLGVLVLSAKTEASKLEKEKPEQIGHVEKKISTELKYVGLMQNQEYNGKALYEDTEYRFYFDEEEAYIVGVQRKEIPTQTSEVGVSDAKNVADAYLKQIDNISIVGEIECIVHDFDGVQYPVEYIETIEGYQTGTRALVLVGTDGRINAATFVQGSQYEFFPEKMISKEDTRAIVEKHICSNDASAMGKLVYVSESVVTLKNQTCRSVIAEDERTGTRYKLTIDIYDGSVVECTYTQ